jgi:hypothetical protein
MIFVVIRGSVTDARNNSLVWSVRWLPLKVAASKGPLAVGLENSRWHMPAREIDAALGRAWARKDDPSRAFWTLHCMWRDFEDCFGSFKSATDRTSAGAGG